MTIPAVRGSWTVGTELTSTELTTFDVNLATRVTDKTGDTVSGGVTVNANMTVNGAIKVNGIASYFVTNSAARIKLGDSDDVVLSPARTRTITMSMLEYFHSWDIANSATSWHWDTTSLGLNAKSRQAGQSPLYLPLTRIHDKAQLQSLTLYFRPPPLSAGTAVPSYFPQLDVLRYSPATGGSATSLRATGAVTFPSLSSINYQDPPALGSSGNVTIGATTGFTATIAASNRLTDTAGNVYQVTGAGGSFANGASVPIAAVSTGASTNHSAGDTLTWATTPTNALPTVTVATGGLTGGLDKGYAQSLTYTPDTNLSTIDQSTYVYLVKITDDSLGGAPSYTTYTGIKMVFGNITSMVWQ